MFVTTTWPNHDHHIWVGIILCNIADIYTAYVGQYVPLRPFVEHCNQTSPYGQNW